MKVFDRMLDMDNRKAFLERKESGFSLSLRDYKILSEYILSDECTEDIRKLIRGDYFLAAPVRKKIRKMHSTRRRTVYCFYGHDKALLGYMAYCLHGFDRFFSDSLYSFRTEKHIRDLFDRILAIDPHRKKYVLKSDVSHYGASIDQDILIEKVRPIVEPIDPELFNFIKWIMTRNQYYENGQLVNERVSIIDGLPIGNFLSNIYLLSLDDTMRRKSRFYVRYTDDMAALFDTYEQASAARELLLKSLGEHHLSTNDEKTEIIPPEQPVNLLGIKLFENDLDIADASLQKIIDRMRRKSRKLHKRVRTGRLAPEKAIKYMIRYARDFFFGFEYEGVEFNWVRWAFPVITRTDSLKTIDHCVQDCIRIAGSGKKSCSRYRVRYKTLNEYGYKSLVHAYYHGYVVRERVKKSISEADTAPRPGRRPGKYDVPENNTELFKDGKH